MIKSVIFDWGGVLIKKPSFDMISYFSKYFIITDKQFIEAYRNYHELFQKGRISEGLLWEKFCLDIKKDIPNVDSLWYQAFKTVYKEQEELFEIVEKLKKQGFKTGFLSNTEKPAMKYFLEHKYNMFDVTVFSCNEGTRKPEKKIYEITINRLGVKPEEAIFIDDKIEFITGAKKIGINTILFQNLYLLKKSLHEYYIKIE